MDDSVVPAHLDQLAVDYKRLWPLMSSLHARIARLAGKEDIKSCARRLGMLSRQNGRTGVALAHELEAEIFQDYLIYMHQPRGISLVQQMFNRKRAQPDSDEHALLAGMVQARFSLFWIRELHPPAGFVALDVIGGGHFFILDQSLPQQDAVGLLSAFRIFPFHGAWLHTGANMVFGTVGDDAGMQPARRVLDRQQERELNEENIHRWRALLKETM
ncbi:MAG: hypothetical protein LBD10_00680 [Desulfobulbus sp.]|uniref:hypothetical protein n=1 Tax=Desulfobulbus sp. TaxID=895 RepID=UPI002846B517|nr:hypothetical protein [Desulfobulbus sp.]MDR2548716.1 hypothetical protein [Desulfobulbus sp.]